MTLALLTSLLLATPNFPARLSTLSAGPLPDCAVCHQSGIGARGTVTTPFGTSLRERGLVAYDEASLEAAWAQMPAVDSDGDGTPDVDELAAGTDPNAGAGSDGVEPPVYGCSATPGFAAWLAFSLIFRRRRVVSREIRC